MFFGDLARTGFGTVTMDLGKALLDLGHDVRFVSQNDLGELPEPFAARTFAVEDPSLLEPGLVVDYGTNSLSLTTDGYAGLIDGRTWPDHWTAEAVFMLGDYMNTRRMVMADERSRAAFASVPTYHYVPIEGVDLPPAWTDMWQIIHPVAMSKFGAEQIAGVTGEKPPMVYHGVETSVFRPVSAEHPLYLEGRKLRSKEDCKRFFGANPKGRWVFRSDRNMPRKRYASFLRAMLPVLARRPDVFVVIHCLTHDQGGNLANHLSKIHPELRKRIILTGLVDQYGPVPRELLIALYNAADVYASPSAEGFGLTIAEAMSCGVPAVGMAYSSVPEVIGPGGLLAPVNHLVDNEYDHAWAAVDEKAFGDAVARLLDDDKLRRDMGRAAREHIVSSFDWAKAALQFSAIIRERAAVAA